MEEMDATVAQILVAMAVKTTWDFRTHRGECIGKDHGTTSIAAMGRLGSES